MKIRVRKKEKQYAQVHKNLLFSERLSIQAKGLGALLECYSDDFNISFESLKIHTNLTDKTLRKYVKQLEENLFLFRIQIIKNCELVWFFDSQNLDINFLISEIEKIKSIDKIRYLTAYHFLTGEKFPREKIATYNNTIKSTPKLSNLDYFQMMYEVQQQSEIKRGSSEFYTSKGGHKKKKQLMFAPRTVNQDEIDF